MKHVKLNPCIKSNYKYLSRNKFNYDIMMRNRLKIKYRSVNNGYINAMNEFDLKKNLSIF